MLSQETGHKGECITGAPPQYMIRLCLHEPSDIGVPKYKIHLTKLTHCIP